MWNPSSFVEVENLNKSELLTCPFCSWARNDVSTGVRQCQVKGNSIPLADVTQHLVSQSRHCSSNVPLISTSIFCEVLHSFKILWEKILTKICAGCIKYHFKDRIWKEFLRGRNLGSFWKYSGQMYSCAFSSRNFFSKILSMLGLCVFLFTLQQVSIQIKLFASWPWIFLQRTTFRWDDISKVLGGTSLTMLFCGCDTLSDVDPEGRFFGWKLR